MTVQDSRVIHLRMISSVPRPRLLTLEDKRACNNHGRLCFDVEVNIINHLASSLVYIDIDS